MHDFEFVPSQHLSWFVIETDLFSTKHGIQLFRMEKKKAVVPYFAIYI